MTVNETIMKIQLTIILFMCFLSATGQEPEQETKELHGSPKSISLKSKSSSGFSFTLGGGSNYFFPMISKNWTDPQNGLGVLLGYNISATLMKKIKKKIGVTLSVAKSFSGVNKEFVTEGVFQYSKQETVDFIPIQVGLRTYLGKKIYFEPRLGIQFINFKTQTSEKHPFGKYSDLEKDSKFSFEFDLGTEIWSRFLVFDLNIYSGITDNRESFGITDPLLSSGLRAQIGFGK